MNVPATIKAARRVSTPLITIRTADPTATIKSITDSFNGNPPPVIQWDCIQGLTGLNKPGDAAIKQLGSTQEDTANPMMLLPVLRKLPADTALFWHNVHRQMEDPSVIQGIWLLRDSFKLNGRTFIGLCPSITLPGELAQDMLVIDEPLPDEKQLADIAKLTYEAAGLTVPEDLSKVVDATLGLAAFPAEQSMAMSLTNQGMKIEELWERKKSLIEQTKGLTVWSGQERYSDIGGYGNLKQFLRDILNGEESPRGIIFIDEIEKSIGSGMDTSGVSQNFLGQLLTWMNDNQASGVILIGPPGTSKSLFAKATGTEGGIPTIALDMGGMKGSLVGESEQSMRRALQVADAVTQKRALFIATCNSIGTLPPELRRRFTEGIFFVDLPNGEERASIWNIYLQKYRLQQQPIPEDTGWTGAEIAQCARLAWRLRRSLKEASSFVVPVSVSARDRIERLRREASGCYISATYDGYYQYPGVFPGQSEVGRKITLEDGSLV